MLTEIKSYCDKLVTQFDTIPAERKVLLGRIAHYIEDKRKNAAAVNLVYICTHNSRRSHFGQVWAHVAAVYYSIENIKSFSGGTEATAFNQNAIRALERIGFEIKTSGNSINPVYEVRFGSTETPITCFSKVYNDAANPQKEFAAIMTCGDAEENCPFIPGTELRIATTYNDPKAFDGTAQQDEKYDERCRQIALETLYVFSALK